MRDLALAAYDAAVARAEIDAARTIAYGRSIGGGPATLLAAARPLRALWLESSFTTMVALVSAHGFPTFLLRDRFDNLGIVAMLKIPVVVLHGRRDRVIPFAHGEALAAAAADAVLVARDCGHNDCQWPRSNLIDCFAALDPRR